MIHFDPSLTLDNPLGDLVVVRGAGDLATGAMVRLLRAGFSLLALEVEEPLAVRRTVAFSEAMYEGHTFVEGHGCARVADLAAARAVMAKGEVALLADPEASILSQGRPLVLVDAIMAKRNLGTRIDQARLVLALGPGFRAGLDAHGVVETKRGHDLGRVLWSGAAEADTGVPGIIGGRGAERVLKAGLAGRLSTFHDIGDLLDEGEAIAEVVGEGGPEVLKAPFPGLLRGLLRDGQEVWPGLKVGDIDPRLEPDHAFTLSDKSLAIGGGVLEAVFAGLGGLGVDVAIR